MPLDPTVESDYYSRVSSTPITIVPFDPTTSSTSKTADSSWSWAVVRASFS